MLIKQFISIFLLLFNISLVADAQSTPRKKEPVSNNISRWNLGNQKDIIWNIAKDNKLPHQDNLEMSGSKVSTIVTYQVDDKRGLKVNKLIIWPSYIMKYDYRSYLQGNFNDSINPVFIINGTKIPKLQVNNIKFNGLLEFNYDVSKIAIKRNIYPSMSEPVLYDRWEIKNLSSNAITIDVDSLHVIDTLNGNEKVFVIESIIKGQHSVIKSNESLVITLVNNARVLDSSCSTQDDELGLKERRNFIELINQKLQLITPDPVLNREFEFAKIRTSESIFDTKMGLVHSPGGGRYYGGVWANDEVEYAGPFFAYLGYDKANEASINAYRIFMSKMTPVFSPIPSSFEMGGDLVYYGSGDRGDAAMYAYGASLFSLARGDENIARELWPAIKWSLEYCERKMTKEGVVASNTDEMEGRVPTGNANLSTSVLAYGGFVNAVLLARSLNEPQCIIDHYSKAAANLKSSIENYFGADIEGYHTYRYFKGHNNLRHWICLPLVMEIDERKDGTIKALFEQLWTPDGLLVEKGLDIFWDRATLYALRGVFKAGATELALKKFKDYSRQRLLGEHIPYPVEAYPEGDQAHLAAESALYCRIITEGLFGIQPIGLKEFDCIPRLPDGWKEMSLLNVAAFSENFDIRVYGKGGNSIQVIVTKAGKEVYSRLGSKGDKFTIAL